VLHLLKLSLKVHPFFGHSSLLDLSPTHAAEMNTAAMVTGAHTDSTSHAKSNGTADGVVHRPNSATTQRDKKVDEATIQLRKSFIKKYRHVAAVHSDTRPSTLSHDAPATPSFLGFRNLMVIVLGEYDPCVSKSVP
jgi:diacylglycerol O-acyltransferase-1